MGSGGGGGVGGEGDVKGLGERLIGRFRLLQIVRMRRDLTLVLRRPVSGFNSGQTRVRSDCPLSAMCGRLRVGKSFLHVCSIGRCSHVFGLLVRHMRPLAIMPSADQVPVNSTHSTMRWHKWVVLIAGSTGSALVMVRPFQRAAR